MKEPVFDSQRALGHAAALSYPRLVGSPGEDRAFRYLKGRFLGCWLSVSEEPFGFKTWPWVLLRMTLACSVAMILIAAWSVGWHPLLSCFLAGLPLAIGLFSNRWVLLLLSKAVLDTVGDEAFRSRNLVARRPGFTRGEGPLIVLMAHYDSKGQWISLGARIFLFLGYAIGGIGLLIRAIGRVGEASGTIDLPSVGFGLLAALSALALLPMRADNRSPGAVDNASGVGVLTCLAESIGKEPGLFPHSEILFVGTGAEEMGLLGAFAFLRKHADDLKGKREVYVLNFDGPGVDGRIYVSSKTGLRPRSRRLVQIVLEAGRDRGIGIGMPAIVIGAMADHFPFAAGGIEAITFSAVGRDSLVIHTPRDTPERLSAEAMGKVGGLALSVIEKIDESAEG